MTEEKKHPGPTPADLSEKHLGQTEYPLFPQPSVSLTADEEKISQNTEEEIHCLFKRVFPDKTVLVFLPDFKKYPRLAIVNALLSLKKHERNPLHFLAVRSKKSLISLIIYLLGNEENKPEIFRKLKILITSTTNAADRTVLSIALDNCKLLSFFKKNGLCTQKEINSLSKKNDSKKHESSSSADIISTTVPLIMPPPPRAAGTPKKIVKNPLAKGNISHSGIDSGTTIVFLASAADKSDTSTPGLKKCSTDPTFLEFLGNLTSTSSILPTTHATFFSHTPPISKAATSTPSLAENPKKRKMPTPLNSVFK